MMARAVDYVKFRKGAVWAWASGRFDFLPLYHWHIMPLALADHQSSKMNGALFTQLN